MSRTREQEFGFWVRFLTALVLAGAVSLGGAILVSLVISGEMPWSTTGWHHLVPRIVLFVTYIAMIICFFVWEGRRRRSKRE